ncbi:MULTISPECIES: DNA polymerase III subunit delta' [Actinomadura]|uniref:DNA polymerase III subunit delta n=1 Tax=Actinomadura litoris TaxID=2678616 RepID=A0A7K1KU50_9ACTN|nr:MULTISPECIES: DNA polymerase III subunit delta' [Actinomadura]MBT2207544.1 DNA polymerase III subunit delta' [Actinomadura sp. NEAU-AAG7]MUN35663.1 DNA polymerase III subunit delta' [Actinomadura litoris]
MSVWDDLVGQEPVVAQLSSAAGEAGGMAHAWLFTGPPGAGRSAAARAFAAALQCLEAPRGCGHCASCHQVLQGTHADLEVVRPAGLSYGVRETRELVLRASSSPSGGRWQIVLFEDADRATEAAANALLKAIEEPPPRTVWLLCTPAPDDLLVTIRSRCRLVTLRTPPVQAVADLLVQRDGVDRETADVVARAAQGHISRARRLATDPQARARRAEVLAVPRRLTGVGPAVTAAEALVKAAEAEAKAQTEELNETETSALRQALGESAKGRMPRGTAGALKELDDRQKSRATRVKRDALDRALLDLASYYRDVLTLQLGAGSELVNTELGPELRSAAGGGRPEDTLRRLDAIMDCRERLEANVNPLLAVEALTLALRTS